jgi:hypothetical protein
MRHSQGHFSLCSDNRANLKSNNSLNWFMVDVLADVVRDITKMVAGASLLQKWSLWSSMKWRDVGGDFA